MCLGKRVEKLYWQTILPFGSVVSLSIALFNSLPRKLIELLYFSSPVGRPWHSHGVCLIVGDESNRTVFEFAVHPLSGLGLPYFQSSYPWVREQSHILPSRLILFHLRTPRRHVPSIPCSCCCCAPFEISISSPHGLTVVRVSRWPPHQMYSAPLDVPSLPCLRALKDTGSSRWSCKLLFFYLKPASGPLPPWIKSCSRGPELSPDD